MPRKTPDASKVPAAIIYRTQPARDVIAAMLIARDRIVSPHGKCRWCGKKFVRVYERQWLCETLECAERQMAHAMMNQGSEAIGSPWLYLPTPFGVEMHEAREKNVLGGGAAGGAKSYTCRWDLYAWCQKIPGYRALLLRRTFPELDRTHLREMTREEKDLPGARLANRVMHFAGDAFVEAGHCDKPSDVQKYLSTEYDDIRFEEASTFETRLLKEIASRARTGNQLVRDRGGAWVRYYSNPGGVGAVYLKEHFIDKAPESLTYRPERYRFIRARISDNPYLDPEYIDRLDELDDDRRRQLLDGDWDTFSGQFFHHWAPKRAGEPWHVRAISELELSGTPALGACVWGYNRPGCFVWARLLPLGRLYIQADMKFQQSPIASVAESVRQRTKDLGLELRSTFAPPSMFPDPDDAKKTTVRAESPSQVFSRFGVTMTSAGGDETHGWQRMHDFLRAAPDGLPWMVVDPTCATIIRTLPTLMQSDKDPDECVGEDYAARALRALVSSRPMPHANTNAPREFAYGTVGWLKRQDAPTEQRVRRIGR